MPLGTYPIAHAGALPSPGIVVYEHLVDANLDATVALAGSPERLRPHCKTHKTHEVIRKLLRRGVTRHKCATPREVQMCLEAGARDVVLAYQPVGPVLDQMVTLALQWPDAQLGALVDCEPAASTLSRAASQRGASLGVLVDLDTGLHRTGITLDGAAALYRQVAKLPGVRLAGLHVYDAQNNASTDPAVRKAAVDATIEPVLALAHQLRHEGLDVPEIVCGGTGTFLYHAQHGDAITASPGTSVFWDWGYTQRFPELNERFTPAALVFGRVISRPGPGYVTLDIGNKAIAADPPVGSRGRILGLEDAKTMQHNEEHWSMSSATAGNFAVGDYALVIPAHICPCTNLHPWLHILNRQGEPAGRWEVAARQRAPLG